MPTPTIQQVIEAVSSQFQITQDKLCGRDMDARFNHPRHVAVLLCSEFTYASRGQIGRALGGRSRGTIANMERRVRDLIDFDPKIYERADRVREALRNQL